MITTTTNTTTTTTTTDTTKTTTARPGQVVAVICAAAWSSSPPSLGGRDDDDDDDHHLDHHHHHHEDAFYPLTSASCPPHLLPVCGIPLLHRLLTALHSVGFTECWLWLEDDNNKNHQNQKMKQRPPSSSSPHQQSSLEEEEEEEPFELDATLKSLGVTTWSSSSSSSTMTMTKSTTTTFSSSSSSAPSDHHNNNKKKNTLQWGWWTVVPNEPDTSNRPSSPAGPERMVFHLVSPLDHQAVSSSSSSSTAPPPASSSSLKSPSPPVRHLQLTVLLSSSSSSSGRHPATTTGWTFLQQQEEVARMAGLSPQDDSILLLPANLILLDPGSTLPPLIQIHLQQQQQQQHHSPATACTVLLTDTSELDEHGLPLKESAKAKKGLLAREEAEMEYMALSSSSSCIGHDAAAAADDEKAHSIITTTKPGRLLWKQAKLTVEQDKGLVSSTPKCHLPKSRLRSRPPLSSSSAAGVVRVRLDWSDSHVYVLSPWVRAWMAYSDPARLFANPNRASIRTGSSSSTTSSSCTTFLLSSFTQQALPALVHGQFQGVRATLTGHDHRRRHHHHSSLTLDPDLEAVFQRYATSVRRHGHYHYYYGPWTREDAALGVTPLGEEDEDPSTTYLSSRLTTSTGTPGLLGGTAYSEYGGALSWNRPLSYADSITRPGMPREEPPARSQLSSLPTGDHHHDDDNDDDEDNDEDDDDEYGVWAHVVPQKSVIRCHSLAAYLYAHREMLARICQASGSAEVPPGATIKEKFQTVFLSGCQMGDLKGSSFKYVFCGENCQLGTQCRLNNVVLMDGVRLGQQALLQNTVVGSGAVLGEGCSLNDCVVAAGAVVPAGTKEKGQVFLATAGDS